ncbi:MAG: hypothetical protein RLZZ225_714 [Pseudomonadota bacterium]
MWDLNDGFFSKEDEAIIRTRRENERWACDEWNQTLNRELLQSEKIKEFIAKGLVSIQQVEGLREEQRLNLSSAGIVKLIDHGIISFSKASKLKLEPSELDFLSKEGICELIINPLISLTLKQALALTEDQRHALNDPNTVQRIINGELNIQQFIGAVVPYHCGEINPIQSTHIASVHRTVSESAGKLNQRYADKICNESRLEEIIPKSGLGNIIRKLGIVSTNLNKTLCQVKKFVNALPDNDSRKKVAKRCIKRIIDSEDSFIDPSSKLSTRKLLALSFAAIRDNKYHQGEIKDAENQFIEGLVEIQRGYNLSDIEKDKPICASGAFNKLIESLQGIHPDCEIHYITKEIASSKLPVIVRENLDKYLSKLIDSAEIEADLNSLKSLIQQMQQNQDFKPFLAKIKKNIITSLLHEFSSLYPLGRHDPELIKLVDSSECADVSKVLESNLVKLEKKRQCFVRSEIGAILRRRCEVATDTLPAVEMESLSLTADESGVACYSADVTASSFWQPSFTSSEDSGSFETSNLCSESSGARSKSARRK